MVNTYFRHYNLYKYAFTPAVRMNLHFNYHGAPVTSKEDEMAVDLEIPVGDQTGQAAGEDPDQLPSAQPLPSGNTAMSSAAQDENSRSADIGSRMSGTAAQAEGPATDRSGATQRSLEPAASDVQAAVDSDSVKLLRELIKGQLSDEIKRLRNSVDDSLKRTEENFNKKLQSVEAVQAAMQGPGGKSGSGKGRKK